MNSVKKLCLIVVLMVMCGISALGQTNGMKIVSVHPDLKIKIIRCEAVAKTAIIDFVFENVGNNDVGIRLSAQTFGSLASAAYDDEGDVYSGSRAFQVKLGKSGMEEYYVDHTLPAGIPIKGQIKIEGLSESATLFRRIDLLIESGLWGGDLKTIKITNVPISREGD